MDQKHCVAANPQSVFSFALLVSITISGCFGSRAETPMRENLEALPAVKADFATPEGAILCLEDAYRRRDLEAAVACKDFTIEARLMLEKLKPQGDEKMRQHMLAQLADVLELAYRKEISETLPDFTGLKSYFPKRESYQEGIVAVTEVCQFPDGGFSEQRILVGSTPRGWRVLNVLDDE